MFSLPRFNRYISFNVLLEILKILKTKSLIKNFIYLPIKYFRQIDRLFKNGSAESTIFNFTKIYD